MARPPFNATEELQQGSRNLPAAQPRGAADNQRARAPDAGRRLYRWPRQLAVIAAWLGHADASVTARIYAHSQADELKAAGQTLGAVVTSS